MDLDGEWQGVLGAQTGAARTAEASGSLPSCSA